MNTSLKNRSAVLALATVAFVALPGSRVAQARMHLGGFLGSKVNGSFDFQKRIVNESESDHVVLDDYSDGLRVQRGVALDVEISPDFNFHTPKGLNVGLSFEGGKEVYWDRWVPTYAAAKAPKLRWAFAHAKDIEEWRVADSALYITSGAIGFSAGPDLGWVNAGVGVAAGGEWTVFIQKLASHKAFVKVTRSRLRSLDVAFDASIASVDVGLFREIDRTFSYVFDLSDRDGARAYEDAIRGSLFGADKLVKANKGNVRRDETSYATQLGRVFSWYVGVPFFWHAQGQSGSAHGAQFVTKNKDGSVTDTRFAAIAHEKGTGGFLSDHKLWINDFYAAHEVKSGSGGSRTTDVGAEHQWGYEDDHVTARDVKALTKDFTRKTGLDFPIDLALGVRDLGYVKFTLQVDFNEDGTNRMLRRIGSEGEVRKLHESAQALLESYFAGGDTDRLCKFFTDEEVRANPDDTRAICAASFRSRTSAATHLMVDSLARMKASLKAGDRSKFAREYAMFGKGLLQNRFAYGAGLRFAGADGLDLSFGIEGERVSSMHLTLHSPTRIVGPIPLSVDVDQSPNI